MKSPDAPGFHLLTLHPMEKLLVFSQITPSNQSPRIKFHWAGLVTHPSPDQSQGARFGHTSTLGDRVLGHPTQISWNEMREEGVLQQEIGVLLPQYRRNQKMDTDPTFSWKTLAFPNMLCDLRPTAFPLWASCSSSEKWAGGRLNSNIPEFWDSFQDWRLLPKSQERSGTSGD